MATTARISINRAPVLTLWAAVVAERLGYERDEALTLGRAVAGLNAQTKGRRLGIYEPAPGARPEKAKPGARGTLTVELLGREVRALRTPQGLRALGKNDKPESPEAAQRYLADRFGEALADARGAMSELARALPPAALATRAFALYEEFRPEVPAGKRGWGAKGQLDLERVRQLARTARE